MPKAKLYRGRRVTVASPSRAKRRKEDGRPKGTQKRFLFEETRLGFFLKYEVPVVFDIIMNLTPPGVIKEPPYLLVWTVCRNSKDVSFGKRKFWRYLEEYKRVGLCCRRPKRLTPERKRYYEGIRRRKLERFVRENRERIGRMVGVG